MADGVQGVTPGSLPAQRVSRPDFVDWHMILDGELTQLSKPEEGVLISLGFVGLGAAFGLLGPFLASWDKLEVATPNLTGSDLASIACFGGSVVLALVCLIFGGIATWRNRGLAEKIRNRGQSS